MNSKILCNWLGITDWPPDHHALLGLRPDEGDVARIEQQVQERMAKLRCYQLSHPEEATEGMNRVAQAFIYLTEALAAPHSAEKAGSRPASQEGSSAANLQKLKSNGNRTDLDWKNAPPPVRVALDRNNPAQVARAAAPVQVPPAQVAAATPIPEPIDPIIQLAQESTEARRGLGTLPAVIERVNQTRHFIIAWNYAGKYVGNRAKKLIRPAEEADLNRRLNKVFELSAEFPKIVGHPGQPGYRVVAMARLEMTAQMFRMLDENQRADLARDWDAGYRLLLAHRRFLRTQLRLLRSRGPFRLVLQAIRSAINDHPVWVCAAVLLALALCMFLYRTVF